MARGFHPTSLDLRAIEEELPPQEARDPAECPVVGIAGISDDRFTLGRAVRFATRVQNSFGTRFGCSEESAHRCGYLTAIASCSSAHHP